MVRSIVAIILGLAVSFGLFYFMAFLISQGDKSHVDTKESIRVELNTTPPESKVNKIERKPPPPPPKPKTPPKQSPPEPENSSSDPSVIGMQMPSVNVSAGGRAGLSLDGVLGKDGDATPIVRVEPRYPIEAARNGTEGWVMLSFTIDELGGVTDVKVIDAQPKRVFDREAKRALRKWKYKPKIEEGKAMKQPDMKVRLDFSLNKSGG
jgi:protein TonB